MELFGLGLGFNGAGVLEEGFEQCLDGAHGFCRFLVIGFLLMRLATSIVVLGSLIASPRLDVYFGCGVFHEQF